MVLVQANFEVSETLFSMAFWSLKESTITEARFARSWHRVGN